MKHTFFLPITIGISIFLFSCSNPQPAVEEPQPTPEPHWSANSTIYEVNLRQMTEEGTFRAFQEQHLDRLAEMGIEILWFMPVYPIGEENRKGTLGSYYAVKDYQAVSAEHGSMEDFKALVDAAHGKGMKVILDWVANHTAWDNAWVSEHPEWYTKDSLGNMVPPVADWADVVDLNYDNAEMREEMIQSLEFWLREADIDGYRCDVAEMVPIDFWVDARARIDSVKPNFFLAEGESAELHEAFDMTYAWSFHHLMNEISRGEKGASDVKAYWDEQSSKYKPEDYRMQFITNHDENSWNGTAIERMGDYRKAFAVMSFTVPGMPLIYSGQEADMNKRLAFFEKDAIDWSNDSLAGFYKNLVSIKTNIEALSTGESGAPIKFIDSGNERVVVYSRTNDFQEVIVMLNFSDQDASISLEGEEYQGLYSSLIDNGSIDAHGNFAWKLPANGYQVFKVK
ncbi:MAG: alpha-amylase family glycosyl hydrolase, partial [Flavobacteriales bacterium]